MNKVKHWFWHIVAMLVTCEWWKEGLTDEEWGAYKMFMREHGYDRVP